MKCHVTNIWQPGTVHLLRVVTLLTALLPRLVRTCMPTNACSFMFRSCLCLSSIILHSCQQSRSCILTLVATDVFVVHSYDMYWQAQYSPLNICFHIGHFTLFPQFLASSVSPPRHSVTSPYTLLKCFPLWSINHVLKSLTNGILSLLFILCFWYFSAFTVPYDMLKIWSTVVIIHTTCNTIKIVRLSHGVGFGWYDSHD
jgi:hypothetical protein